MKITTTLSRFARLLVPVAGMLAASGLVLQASNAAFSATTSNTGNTFAAGTITLVDDDGGSTAMLNTTGMVPGSTSTQCIQLTYSGITSPIDPVKMYAALANEVDGFASYLNVTVEVGSGATFGNCATFSPTSTLYTGTLAALASTHGTYAAGIDVYTPAAGSLTRSLRFTVALQSSAPETAQGDSVGANITWEVRSV